MFDLDALREVLGGIERREIAIHGVETVKASPFASSLLFDYVAAYMYEGDAPLAERRAGALALDRDLLRELLGQEELRELLDPEALADLELSLQSLARGAPGEQPGAPARPAAPARRPVRRPRSAARVEGGAAAAEAWLGELAATRRAVQVRIGGEDRWVAIEDVGRYRDGVGASPPRGVPEVVPRARHRRARRPARPLGANPRPVPRHRAGRALGPAAGRRRGRAGAPRGGRHDPARRVPARAARSGSGAIPEVLRQLRRRSLARLRREVEPVDPETLGPLPAGLAGRRRRSATSPAPLRGSAALERLAEVVDQLSGVPIPASVLERDVLPARIPGYQPRLLDELGALGEVAWVGHGSLGRDDGRVVLYRPGRELLLPGQSRTPRTGPEVAAPRPRSAST